jgi:hypothetical protein
MKEAKTVNPLKESLLMGVLVMMTSASVITIMNMF